MSALHELIWNYLLGGGGGEAVLIQKTITANGTFAAADDNADGYSSVTVEVEGGGALTADVDKIGISFSASQISGDIIINMPDKIVGISGFLNSASAVNDETTVTINAHKIVSSTANTSTRIGNIANKCTKVRTLVLNADEPIMPGDQFLYYAPFRRVLGAPLDCIYLRSGSYRVINAEALEEVYFVPNRIAQSGTVTTAELIDASVISLANALKEGLTSQTLTISNTATKNKCSTIKGIVEEATDGDTTYHMFTADPEGATTLAEFITLTKGWTLA